MESEVSSRARPGTEIVMVSYVAELPPCNAYGGVESWYHLFGKSHSPLSGDNCLTIFHSAGSF